MSSTNNALNTGNGLTGAVLMAGTGTAPSFTSSPSFGGSVTAATGISITNGSNVINNTVASTAGAEQDFKKSRTGGVITTGDQLALLTFQGHDGTQFITSSQIKSTSSGTIGTNRVASNLEFWTHPDSTTSSTQRMVIASTGAVTINSPDSGTGLTVSGGGITCTSGAITATSGNVVISAGNLALPATNDALTQGVITLNSSAFLHYGHNTTNVILGIGAGQSGNTTALYNTYVGQGAGAFSNITPTNGAAQYNVAIGYQAIGAGSPGGNSNTSSNVAVGAYSLQNIGWNGNHAIGIGYGAGMKLAANHCNNNVMIGYGALTAAVGTNNGNSIGDNVFIGDYSATAITNGTTGGINGNTFAGTSSGGGLTTGSIQHNAFFGDSTGSTLTTGNVQYNIFLGSSAGSSYPAASVPVSCICIGYASGGSGTETNILRIGNATGTSAGNLQSAYIYGIYTTAATPSGTAKVSLVDSNSLHYGLAGTSGQILQGGTAPAFSTATYPATTAQGDLLLSTTANAIVALGKDTNATRYLSNTGTNNNAAWAQVALATGVSGTLPIANGGANTNGASYTTDGVLYYDGTGFATTTAGTSTYVLTSNGAGVAPTFQNLSGAVSSVSGTTNQITVSPTTGAAVVSLVASPTVTGTWTSSAGNLALPTTSSTAGQITINSVSVLHAYGANNIFVGGAGNFTFDTGKNYENVGIGVGALSSLVGTAGNQGIRNTICGFGSAQNLTQGYSNCFYGYQSGVNLTTGIHNCLFGINAGDAYTTSESENIIIGGSAGIIGESNVLRIGDGTGTGSGQLNAAYICGIRGITVTGTAVLISASNQLGIAVSSRKYKKDIVDMSDKSEIISKLRPVEFRYKDEKQSSQLNYGLIAEEVEKVWPEMVAYDKDGNISTLYYQFLAPILLKEVQRQNKVIDNLMSRLERLEAACLKN